MDDMRATIDQYEEGCIRLHARIAELCQQIGEKRAANEEEQIKSLEARRYRLYTEVAEMQRSIAAMRDYLGATGQGAPATDSSPWISS